MFRCLFLLTACVTVLPGCAAMQPVNNAFHGMVRTFKPNSNGYRDFNEDSVSDEYAIVGIEGRGDQPKERADDPLYDKIFKSKRHRDIEANLGFRH